VTGSRSRQPELSEAYRHCQRLAKRAAGNFYYSFLGLPPRHFRAMCALYAFMRVTDDLADSPGRSTAERLEELRAWEEQLRRALKGSDTADLVLRAIVDVVDQFGIPPRYLLDVVDGVRMDLQGFRCETFDDLRRYCYHVAGAVGLCCIHIWGFRQRLPLEEAEACGLAFQLTNILRDLGEDVDAGRVYLPAEDLRRFDYSVDDLRRRVQDDRFRRLMAFQVERARGFYRQAEGLFQWVQPVGHPILRAMLRVYGGILNEIERREFDVFSRRVSLPKWRKVLIAAAAVVAHRLRPEVGGEPKVGDAGAG